MLLIDMQHSWLHKWLDRFCSKNCCRLKQMVTLAVSSKYKSNKKYFVTVSATSYRHFKKWSCIMLVYLYNFVPIGTKITKKSYQDQEHIEPNCNYNFTLTFCSAADCHYLAPPGICRLCRTLLVQVHTDLENSKNRNIFAKKRPISTIFGTVMRLSPPNTVSK